MKILLTIILCASISSVPSIDAKGDDHNEGHGEAAELPGGVVSFHDEEAEFTLRPNVVKNFGVGSIKVTFKNGTLAIPETAVVRSLSKLTIFERKGNTFRSIPVKMVNATTRIVVIQPLKKLQRPEIVDQGTNFLQTILLSLEEGPSEGHGH